MGIADAPMRVRSMAARPTITMGVGVLGEVSGVAMLRCGEVWWKRKENGWNLRGREGPRLERRGRLDELGEGRRVRQSAFY